MGYLYLGLLQFLTSTKLLLFCAISSCSVAIFSYNAADLYFLSCTVYMDMSAYQKKIDGHLAYLNQEFGGLQLGRATPGLLDNVTVAASYGIMKLNQL